MPEVQHLHELVPGAIIGHYTIIEHIAEGGMGHVFKAFEPSLQREVAIKVLKQSYSQDPEQLEQFEAEAQSIASLRHPNIVPIYFVGQQGEIKYFVMPFISGHTLDDWIDDERVMTLAEAEWAMGQAIDALDKAYQQNVVHLDIKPSNFLIDEDGTLLLTDFGLARTLGQSRPEAANAFGTPAYMAPEQIKREASDQRSDIYSLGASLYHLMTGELLYDAETITGIVKGHVYNPFPIERAEHSGLLPGWIHLLEKMTRKDPAERYQNYRELRDALVNINRLRPLQAGHDEDVSAPDYVTVTPHGAAAKEALFGLLSPRCVAWQESGVDYSLRRTREEIMPVIRGKGIKPLQINAMAKDLKEMLASGEPTMDDMAALVEDLPEVESYILSLANHRCFNASGEAISTRRKAIRTVGLSLTQKFALTWHMLKKDNNQANHDFDWRPYWAYAMTTGIVGKLLLDLVDGKYVLAQGVVADKPKRALHTTLMRRPLLKAYDYIYEAGLIHGIGKLVLGEAAAYTYYVAARRAFDARVPLVEAETEILSISHHEAGEIWVQAHTGDSNLRGICENYGDLSANHGLLCSTIAVASYLTRSLGLGYSGDPILKRENIWETPAWAALARYGKDQDLDHLKLESEFLTALSELPLMELTL
jgi:HD-like signal output (HDOD) protein